MSFPDSEAVGRIQARLYEPPDEDTPDPQEEYWAEQEEAERRWDSRREEGQT